MNKSGNVPPVKLPKVNTIGNSSVSNTSMKAIWDANKKPGPSTSGSKEENRK
jgi:hypothetical protein